ncbi:MAG: C25 family cysteine peptidase [candidate division WOR-3 bacterium]
MSCALRHPGVDDADRLRNFIINGYNNYGLTWVLLAGDAGIVPYRKGTSENFPPPPPQEKEEKLPPSDLYFSDMNGNCNADGDEYWGEPTHDAVDIYPEVFVGRVLVRSPIEARNWVEKNLIYEQYGSTMPELYAQTTWIYDSIGRINNPHGGPLYPLPETREKFPPYFTHFNFDSRWGYEVGEALKWGTGFYQIYLHGGPGVVTCDGRTCYHVYAYLRGSPYPEHGLNYLDNDGRYYVVYAISCWVAAYDSFGWNPYGFIPTDTTLADGFTDTYARKGAVAFLGNTRSGYYWSSHYLHDAFCRLLFGSEIAPYSLGVIEGWSKVYYPSHWHLVHAHNLFGSPEIEPWINKPKEIFVDHPTFIPVGVPSEFTVRVRSDIGPLPNVRVCLYKRDPSTGLLDIYQIGWTDALGRVTFIIHPQSIGTLKVTCTRPRLLTTAIPEYTQYLPTRTICRVGIGGDEGKDYKAAQRLERPERLSLTTTSPIPNSGNLKVFYGLPENGRVKITLYDLSGRGMVLKDEMMGAGYYAETFSLNHTQLGKGIYWLQLRTEKEMLNRKLVLIR